MRDFIVSDESESISIGDNIKLKPGQNIEELTMPFQELAKAYGVLPEFGITKVNRIRYVLDGDVILRIIYNMETNLITEFILINSAL